jgi:ABC-type lipoprotein release transport system permease subunit
VAICVVVGLIVGLYLGWWILCHTDSAAIIKYQIDYMTEVRHSDMLGVAYLVATSLPMVFSSRRTLTVLGAIVLIGSVTAHISYWEAFTSVWCFFAAAASIVVFAHFAGARRNRLRIAGA